MKEYYKAHREEIRKRNNLEVKKHRELHRKEAMIKSQEKLFAARKKAEEYFNSIDGKG